MAASIRVRLDPMTGLFILNTSVRVRLDPVPGVLEQHGSPPAAKPPAKRLRRVNLIATSLSNVDLLRDVYVLAT
ncbi:unnamed protein product [Tilletia controversa]|nr:unnamed protein product [Tilletia controversa]